MGAAGGVSVERPHGQLADALGAGELVDDDGVCEGELLGCDVVLADHRDDADLCPGVAVVEAPAGLHEGRAYLGVQRGGRLDDRPGQGLGGRAHCAEVHRHPVDPARSTPADNIRASTGAPEAVSPVGDTGRVSQTARLRPAVLT